MTNEQILKKAIEKAVKNGLKELYGFEFTSVRPIPSSILMDLVGDYEGGSSSKTFSINDIIFSHDFAKAFWGEEIKETYGWDKGNHGDNREKELKFFCYTYRKPAWKYHLQQLVLEKEPLKYIAKFL